jgi:precorrin-2 dehydrogenase/sirohydrochlorin ferrochelatase
VRALWEAGADVVVIAPILSEKLAEWVETGQVTHCAAQFEEKQLQGAFLVVAATNLPAVNTAVREAANAQNILVNVAGAEEGEASSDFGDFTTMATVRRGDLLIAIATGGAGPALSARLRRELEVKFGDEWGEYVSLLGKLRDAAKAHIPDATARAEALRRLAEDEGLFEKVMNGNYGAAWEEGLECLLR